MHKSLAQFLRDNPYVAVSHAEVSPHGVTIHFFDYALCRWYRYSVGKEN